MGMRADTGGSRKQNRTMRHPEHDKLTETVRGWYHFSATEMGYIKERRRFGIFGRNVKARDGRGNEVLLQGLDVDDVPALMRDVHAYYGGAPVRIVIDDRAVAEELGPRLLAFGCATGGAESYLAHVGTVPAIPLVAGLTVDAVDGATLTEYAVTKLKGFANSEAEPSPAAIETELAIRRAEIADVGRIWLARLDGQPASVLAWYEDTDQFIFNLTTRVPFRHRGIAHWLLSEFLRQSYARGCRSIIINANPEDRPIQLYRSLGFTDEVYWRIRYNIPGLPDGL